MKKLLSFLVVMFTTVTLLAQTTYYVNDNSQLGDVFTTAVGNDANNGTPAAPFSTLSKAYQTAQAGDTIYMDAGTYSGIGVTVGKPLTIRGANYMISPNNTADPLIANVSRNAETIINTSTFTIGNNNIEFSGFTFNPQTGTQFLQTNGTLDFDNITLSKNIFRVTSNLPPVNITGKQVNPLVTFNYTINDNRFVKESGATAFNININAIENVLISSNTFTTDNSVINNARVQNGILPGPLTGTLNVLNNTAYQLNFFENGQSSSATFIRNNTAIDCNRFVVTINSQVNPNQIEITDNIVSNPKSNGAPVITYARNNGINLGSPNIARIERNTITLDPTGLSSVAQALIAPTIDNLSINTQVFIRDNKLTITGDFSTQSAPGSLVSAIRFLNNSRQAVVERNEIQFTATNYGTANKFGIAVLHSGLLPDASFNFLNNKVSGFPTSVGIQNQATGNYGELPNGVTMNINNNSFTGDAMSINNGTSGQSAFVHCNWYGSAAAQDFISKISLSTVELIPWLTNGTDNDAATGFQPVPNTCDGYPTLITLDRYTNVTCNGAANGTISITTSYGKAPFAYTWTKDGDANFVSHDEDPTGLAPGVYHLAMVDGNGSNIYITAVDANGPGTIVVTITEPAVLTATASVTNNLCYGQSNGTASVNAGGGTTAYNYLWSNGATTSSISNLSAGIYSVTVTDANGCSNTSSYEVTQPLLLTATASGTNVSCFGGNNGTASVNAGGGTAAYSYLWSNGETTSSISNLIAGIYSVTVTDANGCTNTSSYEVTQPLLLTATASGTNVSCFGGNNGTAGVLAGGGGTTGYSYLWSNGATTSSISNLSAGTYSVTVTDANGCTANTSYEVTQPSLLTASAGGTNVSCFGGNNGTASVLAGGGTTAYSYLWSNGATTASISNLSAGIYSVTVTDANGCTANSSYEVTQPTLLTATASGTNVSCNGGNNGTASVLAGGGTTAYSYLWSNGATTSSISNLTAGIYSVTVTDANGCTASSSYEVTQPLSAVTASVAMVNNICYNGTAGSITVTASGGTAAYSYSLDGTVYQTGNVFNNLAAATYTVYVMDANGCIFTTPAVITQPSAIVITFSNIISTCAGTATGAVSSNAVGGTGTFIYSWTGPNGFTKASKNINNLVSGVYNLTVTDANGCTATGQVTIPALPAITASAITTPVQCYNTLTGAINLTPGGGSGTFSFNWTGPGGYKASTEDISNVKAGTYAVTITADAAGCSLSQSYTIFQPAVLSFTTTSNNITVCGGTGSITVSSVSGGTSPYQYSINNGAYQTGTSFTGLAAATYTITVIDSRGCTKTTSVTISDTGYDLFDTNTGNNDKQSSAGNIALGQQVLSRIAPTNADVDWYKFTTTTVGSYTMTFTHPSVTYVFALYDSKGKVINPSASTATSKTYNTLAAGTVYYIKINGTTASFVCYTLQVNVTGAPLAANRNQVIQQPVIMVDALKAMVFPNPHQGAFGIKIEALQNGIATVEIINVTGQRIATRKVSVTKGGNNVVHFSNMHQPALIYRVTLGDEVKTGKILSAN